MASRVQEQGDSDRQQLGIFGMVAIPSSEYLAIPNPTD